MNPACLDESYATLRCSVCGDVAVAVVVQTYNDKPTGAVWAHPDYDGCDNCGAVPTDADVAAQFRAMRADALEATYGD